MTPAIGTSAIDDFDIDALISEQQAMLPPADLSNDEFDIDALISEPKPLNLRLLA